MKTNTVNQNESTRIENPAVVKEQPNKQPASAEANKSKSGKSSAGAGAVGAGVGVVAGLGASAALGAATPPEETNNGLESSKSLPVDFDGSQVPVASGVTDDMSFADAFAAAREETGAGGYFQWHGKWYGTYNKEEWENLPPEHRNAYSSYPGQHHEGAPAQAGEHPSSSPDYTADASVVAGDGDAAAGDNVEVLNPEAGDATAGDSVEVLNPEAGDAAVLEVAGIDSNPDSQPEIEVLGQGSEPTDVTPTCYAEVVAEGEVVALVDLDADGNTDLVIVDDGAGGLAGCEVAAPEEGQSEPEVIAQVDCDMPDYTNDGNVDGFIV
jgi:hypothetical protein